MLKKYALYLSVSIFATHLSFADYKLASKDNFDILVGGEFGTEMGVRIQDNKYAKVDTSVAAGKSPSNIIGKQGVTSNNKNIGMDSSASLHTIVQNMSDKNFSYGAHIGIKTTTRSKSFAGKGYLERSYIFFQGSDWGKIELGSNEGASRSMMIKGKKFDAGSGNWSKYVSFNTYSAADNFKTPEVNQNNFLTSAKLVFQEAKYESNHETFRKVTYYTPKFNGFQFGISYIPDASNKPDANNGNFPYNPQNSIKAEEKNAFSGGISWEHAFAKNHSLVVSLVGETGAQKSAKSAPASAKQKGNFHRSQAIAIGGKYIKDKISFALGYGNRGKSQFKKDLIETNSRDPISPKTSYFVSVGGAYKILDNSSLSITYLHTKHNTNPLDVVYLGVNNTAISGVKLYAETAYFKATQKRNYNASTSTITTGQNFKVNGAAFITGIKLRF